MSPFQRSHQPTHAGQPAGALDFAPDGEPIASTFDGEEGPSFDLAFLDPWIDQPTGLWGSESQSALDHGLDEHGMMPSFNAEGRPFDGTPNNWTDETLGFSTEFVSQGVLGQHAMMPPFDPNPWMGQPGPFDAEFASQSTPFAHGQAPITSGAARSYLQASFDDLYSAGWTNENAGMLGASGSFAYSVR
jgi:hypothetical protein